jgi:hypothetical protein
MGTMINGLLGSRLQNSSGKLVPTLQALSNADVVGLLFLPDAADSGKYGLKRSPSLTSWSSEATDANDSIELTKSRMRRGSDAAEEYLGLASELAALGQLVGRRNLLLKNGVSFEVSRGFLVWVYPSALS